MKYILLLLALALVSCDSEPIEDPASTTRSVTNDTITDLGISLQIDTAWAGNTIIRY